MYIDSYLLQRKIIWKTGIEDDLQKRYILNYNGDMRKIFEDLNNWTIVKLESSNIDE